MKKAAFAKMISVLTLLLLPMFAWADEVATLTDGRKIELKDDGTYQLIPSKKSADEKGYPEIKLADLKVDIRDMTGKRVRVDGRGSYFGEMLMLGDPDQPFDASPLFVKTDELPREDRKWIVTHSGQPCTLTIEGEIKEDMVLLTPGISASNIFHQ